MPQTEGVAATEAEKEEEEKEKECGTGESEAKEDREPEKEDGTPVFHIYGDSDQEVVAWATHTLQRYYPGENFCAGSHELRDGIALIKLIECLMDDVVGRYYAEPEGMRS